MIRHIKLDGDNYLLRLPYLEEYERIRQLIPDSAGSYFLRQKTNTWDWYISSKVLPAYSKESFPLKPRDFEQDAYFCMDANGRSCSFNKAEDGFLPILIPLDKARKPVTKEFAGNNPDGVHLEGGSVYFSNALYTRTAALPIYYIGDAPYSIGDTAEEEKYRLHWIAFDGCLVAERPIFTVKSVDLRFLTDCRAGKKRL